MTSVRRILIKGGRVIDPSQSIDKVADVAIADAKILGVDSGIELEHAEVIRRDRDDRLSRFHRPAYSPPGAGVRVQGDHRDGYDSGGSRWIHDRMRHAEYQPGDGLPIHRGLCAHEGGARRESVRVLPIGAVTKGSRGKELAEMGELAEAGVIGFSDDGHPVSDDNVMRQALGYASSLGLPIINHAEVKSLSSSGVYERGLDRNVARPQRHS